MPSRTSPTTGHHTINTNHEGRRADHEGSIRKRGSRWQARVQLEGRVHSVSGATRREAVAALQRLVEEFHSGALGADTPTVATLLSDWLVTGCEEWKPTTTERYRDIVRIHLEPRLGQLQLTRLTPLEVEACLSSCKASTATRLKVYRVLHRAFAVAVYRGLIPANPCDFVEAPRAPKYRPRLWTVAQLRQFLAGLKPTTYDTLWSILVGTGCRLGEALALTWSDYDAETGHLQIRATLSEARGRREVDTPKTASAVRSVAVPGFASELLSKHMEREGISTGHIFRTERGNTITRALAGQSFQIACERLRVPPVRIHDLRHLHASALLESGVPLTTVSARLGHASPAITASVYAHAISARERFAADCFQAFVGKAVEGAAP